MATTGLALDVTHDWVAASEVQQRFMHFSPAIESVCYNARCRQVRELGGDFYDFVQLPNDRLALAIGDASGKGLAAALMISSVQSSLRTAASFIDDDPAAVVEVVNRQVYASSLANRYATLFYGVFDELTRALHYLNAGHNPPMIVRPDGSATYLDAGGPPVGMFPTPVFTEGRVQLNPGDILLAYTDGVSEAVDPSGCEWGTKTLLNVARDSSAGCSDDIVEAIFNSMDNFSHGHQIDDATVLVLHVH